MRDTYIGGRSEKDIIDDPQATWAEIQTLPMDCQVVHPNIPLAGAIDLIEREWRQGNRELAKLVFENPSFALWELDDASSLGSFWLKGSVIVANSISGLFSPKRQVAIVLFMAKLAIEALPAWEDTFPEDDSARYAIKLALSYCEEKTYISKVYREAAESIERAVKFYFKDINQSMETEIIQAAANTAIAAADSVCEAISKRSSLAHGGFTIRSTVHHAALTLFGYVSSRREYEWHHETYQYAERVASMTDNQIKAEASRLKAGLEKR